MWRSRVLGPGDCFGEVSFFTETPALEVSQTILEEIPPSGWLQSSILIRLDESEQ